METSVMLHVNGDGCWPDLGRKQVHHVTRGVEMARLPGGMTGGKTSVSILVPLGDGEVALAEVSLDLLDTAVKMFRAADVRDGA